MRSFFTPYAEANSKKSITDHHSLTEICQKFNILPEHVVIEQIDIKRGCFRATFTQTIDSS